MPKNQIAKLLFNFYSLNMIEETTGRGVPALIAEIERASIDPFNCKIFSSILRLYWAGRIHEKSNISLKEASEEIQQLISSGVALGEIGKAVVDGITASGLFDKEEEDPKPAQEPEKPPQ